MEGNYSLVALNLFIVYLKVGISYRMKEIKGCAQLCEEGFSFNLPIGFVVYMMGSFNSTDN